MAQGNHERVGRALELLNEGLKPYVERELKAAFKTDWAAKLKGYLPEYGGHGLAVQPEVAFLVKHLAIPGKRSRTLPIACAPSAAARAGLWR